MGSHWKSDLGTGHTALDEDHRALLEILDALDAASTCGDGAQARGLLGEFLAECGAHFAREEALMVEIGYAEAVAHRAAHALYLDDLRRFLKSAPPPESPGFRLYIGSRLLGWFLQHIKAHDCPLAAAALRHAPPAAQAAAH
jgi:hemerythrin